MKRSHRTRKSSLKLEIESQEAFENSIESTDDKLKELFQEVEQKRRKYALKK